MKNINKFEDKYLLEWERNDGVNFAIALARITGWILHVDWWTPTDNQGKVENMKSLRVYVGDNSNYIFDFNNLFNIETFTNSIIRPILQKRSLNNGGVTTRYYNEDKLFTLPLRVKPNEEAIRIARYIILENLAFLKRIPNRKKPNVPAHIACEFTYGKCNPFATALSIIKNYKVVALIALEYVELFNYSKLGYVHSFTIDNNGNAIDIWGIDTIENIAKRFGVLKYKIDEAEHEKVSQTLKRNSPLQYEEIYEKSVAIVMEYFN